MRRIVLAFIFFCFIISPTVIILAQEDSTEFVIATHYPEFGGTQPAPTDAVEVAYTVYNNRENDYYAVDQATADEIVTEIQDSIFRDVLLLNDWAEVQENLDALQIVNNVPVEGALYTIFLPPNWNRAQNLPIVLSGNGAGTSNNRRLYGGETDMGIIIGLSTTFGGDGIIGAMSNCGGTESQGVDEQTYRSVGAFFDFLDENGGDKMNAVTAGWSRGGGSALMWAINPLGLDYNVHTVFAGVPPVRYGALSQVSVLTYPSMGNIGVLISGDENAWRYDNEGWHSGMNPSPFLDIILGTSDPTEADMLGPWGMAEGLRGKNIVLEAGSHDAFFSLRFILEYDRYLTELDIAHGTIITLNSGHEDTDFMREALLDVLLAMSNGDDFETLTGRYYYIDINPNEDEEMSLAEFFEANGIQDDPTQLPVLVEFPFRAGVGNPVDINVCGTPGDVIDLNLSLGDVTAYSLSITIDENECFTEQVIFEVEPGVYYWELTLNGEVLSLASTPGVSTDDFPAVEAFADAPADCHIAAMTIIEADQQPPQESYAARRTMSFGMIEYEIPGSCLIG